ncbi:MAG: right-handed parallel beta-helix repeat-containing protein [Deltaproteobacteria bacterium]|nr:right-handed parallel beta-helix repeat-containing protein [Deltaproteobacteria bacterium]
MLRSLLETIAVALAAATMIVPTAAEAIVFEVNSTADTIDANPSDGFCSTGSWVVDPTTGPAPECTLRAAIEQANGRIGRDVVRFSSQLLYGADGVAWFRPTYPYPWILDVIEIDGTTAPHHDPDRTPRVVIVPNGPVFAGLDLVGPASGSEIRGLSFGGFFYGIRVWANRVWIEGCAFGIHEDTAPYIVVHANEIGISVSGDHNWIGAKVENGAFVGRGNVVSGNVIGIENSATNTHIIGNKIGTDSSGTIRRARSAETSPMSSLGNTEVGILVDVGIGLEIGRVVQSGSAQNPTYTAMGNVISNNGSHGIEIHEFSSDPTAPGMKIVANEIGTDATGMLDFGNGDSGILVSRADAALVIGGDVSAASNLVSGNGGDGIETGIGGVRSAKIVGNRIGVAADGLSPLPNGEQGIRLDGGDDVRVEGNLVGHSPNDAILIGDTPTQEIGSVEVVGNYVGMNQDGDALPNTGAGIRVEHGWVTIRANTIGNARAGIVVRDAADQIEIYENFVGTDELARDQGNVESGVLVSSILGANAIGDVERGNVIGWNGGSGIVVDQSANANLIVGNFVGVHSDGTPIPNGDHGVHLRRGAGTAPAVIGSHATTPEADLAGRANRIAYNVRDAVALDDGSSASIRGNWIKGNGKLAIDLNDDGKTANDSGDVDQGANRLQNSPDLDRDRTEVDDAMDELRVEYRVTSDVGATAYPLTIDFYLADRTTLGPIRHLGSDSYPAAAAHQPRRATFSFEEELENGYGIIVATATSSLDETSEVRTAVLVPEPGLAASLAVGLLGLRGLARRSPVEARRARCPAARPTLAARSRRASPPPPRA